MKTASFVLFFLLTPLFVAGCVREHPGSHITTDPVAEAPVMQGAGQAVTKGKVVETMNSGGYTYVHVDTGSEKIWAAAPERVVSVGDDVTISLAMPMRNFPSKTLDRTFDLVYFVNSFDGSTGTTMGSQPGLPSGHPPMGGGAVPTDVDVSGVEKAEGGQTVEEIYASKADLAGKEVTVRGKVVKYNAQILRKNWLHIRDGSGADAAGTNDLTVTTDVDAKIGDTVLVKGVLQLDKDFGAGYRYDLIVEDAKVVVE